MTFAVWSATAEAATWSLQRTPDPAGAPRSVLSTVSCASEFSCTAVGDYTTRRGAIVTLAETWNGVRWSLQRAPDPAGARRSVLSMVSCVTSVRCEAVGNYTTRRSAIVTLAERYS